jgi:hypothetical protein
MPTLSATHADTATEALECRSCHMLIHLKYMEPPLTLLENVPKRVWHCASCRDSFQFSKLEDVHLALGVGLWTKIMAPLAIAATRCTTRIV